MNNLIPFTKQLLTIPSDVNNRDACLLLLQTIQQSLQAFPFTAFTKNRIPSILYTNTKTPQKTCKIILNAHLDVVPGKKEQFVPYEKEGKLYGRGAYDMKAAAAVMILLFKELANKLPYTLGLQLTTDEEIVGFNGVQHQLNEGVTADFIISGECGGNLQIINQLKGLLVVELIAKGTTAHAAYPWKGENALLTLYQAIQQIMQRYPTPQEPVWESTVNLAKIKTANNSHNKVPHEARALFDIRFIAKDAETIFTTIQSLLPTGITINKIKQAPAHYTKETNPYIQQLIKTYETIMHHPPQITQSHGGSDIVFFSEKGINAIEFGPKGEGQHSDNEWVDIQSLTQYATILKHFLLSLPN
jgi:succinyl-diaminopimelate desuccinylase